MSGHSLKMSAVKRLRLALLAVAVCMPVSAQASEQASPRKVPEALALPLVKPRLGDFEAMRERRIVRILVPYSRTLFFIDRGRRQGVAAELGWRFEDWLNKRYRTGKFRMQVVFVPTRRDQILPALERGLGDIAAADLTITPERERQVAFAPPWSDKVAEILVTGPAAPALATIEDLSGREVHVRASSSYALHLQALSAALTAKGREPIRITALDERLEDEDVLDMVQGRPAAFRRGRRSQGQGLVRDPPQADAAARSRRGEPAIRRLGVPERQPAARRRAVGIRRRASPGHGDRQ
ncbi:transporter substrate-binding domain-containing protein [Bosea thiooxidans]